jgi:capsule polysaccharide export protein KpsE/RkpR
MAPPTIDLSFLQVPGAFKRVVTVTAVFALLGTVYALLAPRWYQSVLGVVPAKQQKGGLSSLLGSDLGGLAAGLDVASVGGGGADAQRIMAVLQSTAVSDAVIAKLDLKARYDEKYQESARDELWRHCEVKALAKPNLVTLTCEDKDPKFVQQMLEHFAEVGNEVFQRVNVSTAGEEVRTMEKRVAELRAQADEVASRMRAFQEKHQIVDLESQARALVSSVALLNSQRIAKQMELDYAQRFSAADESSSRQLRSQLSVVDEQLREMELPAGSLPGSPSAAPGAKRKGTGLFPAALEVPALRAEFEKLYRDRKVAEATLIFALDRLESARAAKARDVSTFVVLDPPTVPERRHRPKRLAWILGSLALGLVAGVGREWWRSGQMARALAPVPRQGP